MAMLKVIGNQLSGYTAYNEYIADVIVSFIVYFSAFALLIRSLLFRSKSKKKEAAQPAAEPEQPTLPETADSAEETTKGGEDA